MVVVEIKVFTFAPNINSEHGYLVGCRQGGISDVLGSIHIDERTCTFERVRGSIELGGGVERGTSGGRRSVLFREILYECENSKNPHSWSKRVRRSSYRLGYVCKEEDEAKEMEEDKIPSLIPLEIEGEENVVSFLRKNARRNTNIHAVELIVIPLSQVGPGCGMCCCGCTVCTESKIPGCEKVTTYYQDGRIQSVHTNLIEMIDIDSSMEFIKPQ